MTKINIKSSFALRGGKIEHINLGEIEATLGVCLKKIETLSATNIVDWKLQEIYPDIEVILNNIYYDFLPNKMETIMNNEDDLIISMITMGGG